MKIKEKANAPVHPVIDFIRREIYFHGLAAVTVCKNAKVSHSTFYKSAQGNRAANLQNTDAILKQLGYRLTVEKIDAN